MMNTNVAMELDMDEMNAVVGGVNLDDFVIDAANQLRTAGGAQFGWPIIEEDIDR